MVRNSTLDPQVIIWVSRVGFTTHDVVSIHPSRSPCICLLSAPHLLVTPPGKGKSKDIIFLDFFLKKLDDLGYQKMSLVSYS